MTPTTAFEVFRSFRKADCAERAFVLTAVGIPNHMFFDGWHWVLTVEEPLYEAARTHLARYASESRPPPPPPPPQRLYPFALFGCVVYALALVLIGYAVASGAWRLDAFDVGAIDSARVQEGQWWRAWTALTLHVDAAHLFANLGAGAWFGYLAGRQLGPGNAWLLTVIGAGLANLIESLLGPGNHHSVGASTAVFTTLGLMAAYTWRIRYELPQRWALRWGPLVAGALLLGWLGTGGLSGTDPPDVVAASTTDIVAHATGFFVGSVLGATAAVASVRKRLAQVPQWVSGIVAAGVIAIAWSVALSS
jgi:membrane associated rhomboid family serine protease